MPLDVTRAESRLQEARQRLEHARTSRLAQLRALDESGQAAEDHLASAQKASVEQVLKEIDEAFARLRAGTYGTCAGCGKAIPAERLEILPYTRHCVACQGRTA